VLGSFSVSDLQRLHEPEARRRWLPSRTQPEMTVLGARCSRNELLLFCVILCARGACLIYARVGAGQTLYKGAQGPHEDAEKRSGYSSPRTSGGQAHLDDGRAIALRVSSDLVPHADLLYARRRNSAPPTARPIEGVGTFVCASALQ